MGATGCSRAATAAGVAIAVEEAALQQRQINKYSNVNKITVSIRALSAAAVDDDGTAFDAFEAGEHRSGWESEKEEVRTMEQYKGSIG